MSLERINLPKFQAGVAALWLGIAALNGGQAFEANNDAIRADAQAEVYEYVGQPDQATQLQAEADEKQDDRNHDLLLVGLNLTAAAGFAGAAALGRASRRIKENA